MAKQILKALVFVGCILLVSSSALAAVEPTEEAPEASAEQAAAPEVSSDTQCVQEEAVLPGLDLALANPTGTPVCTFCNLNGFVNCESFTGTACNPPQPNRRCYINPPCACEWGTCRCNASTSTWQCFW